MKSKKLILCLVGVSFLFGIFDFHYQNTVSPLFQKLFGNSDNILLLFPMFVYILSPWYLLSIYVLSITKKFETNRFIFILKNTVLAYLISVFSYYTHYEFLLFFVGLPNFEYIKGVFTIENLNYAFSTLFLPGVIEWSIGAIILGSIVTIFNHKVLPLVLIKTRNFELGERDKH